MIGDARIDVKVRLDQDRMADLAVTSTRRTDAAALLAGRNAQSVIRLLPSVFSLCGTAQAMAGLAAMEQAMMLTAAPPHHQARHGLVLGETLAEHAMALGRDWPMLMDAPPHLAPVKTVRQAVAALRPALYPAGDWDRLGGGVLAPDRQELGRALALARQGFAQLLGDDWNKVPLLDMVTRTGLADFGAGPMLDLPPDGPPDLAERLGGDDGDAYAALPDMTGAVPETGPLARCLHHPLVTSSSARHGYGLLTRLLARLADLESAISTLDNLVRALPAHSPDTSSVGDGGGEGGGGYGCAWVQAARGLLAHHVVVEGGLVRRYRILAPTEWNFHPKGVLARVLTGAPIPAQPDRAITLLVHALDPCVACTVGVE